VFNKRKQTKLFNLEGRMKNTSNLSENGANLQKIAGGVILILAGVMLLLARWLDIGMFLVLLMGAAMLTWGAISRRVGWIIPGGLLSGIGLGILALEGPFKLAALSEAPSGGVFMLCFALGWFLVALVSRLVACKTMWWALIPGGIMAVLGGVMLLGGEWLKLLELSNFVWPVAMILAGIYLVFRWSRAKTN
jgi:hypothetical protein